MVIETMDRVRLDWPLQRPRFILANAGHVGNVERARVRHFQLRLARNRWRNDLIFKLDHPLGEGRPVNQPVILRQISNISRRSH